MDASSGSASGFSLSIYAGGNTGEINGPVSFLGSLSGSANPASAGVYTYTTAGLKLSASKDYYVVATATTPLATGAYTWSEANSFVRTADDWEIEDSYYGSANGTTWNSYIREGVFQIAIFATPAPEPSSLALVVVGGGVLFFARKRKRSNA